ncbi:transposable element Tcb1 transposase [Trichonephila clavipes]|nr:transposable element Tcb1 transposase [Trichonephila clavipes]
MSFTRRPGSGHPLQTVLREDCHIVRNSRVQLTASSAAIQANDESRFSLSSDDNRVHVRRLSVEPLNPAFVLQRHTVPTAGAMVRGAFAYNTRSCLVLFHDTMTAVCPRHPATTCVVTHSTALSRHFSTRQCSASHGKGVIRLSPNCYYHSLACPIPRFVSNRAHLGSFGTASWASLECERTKGKGTANMKRNVSTHQTQLVYLNARSYRIVHSRWYLNGNDLKVIKDGTFFGSSALRFLLGRVMRKTPERESPTLTTPLLQQKDIEHRQIKRASSLTTQGAVATQWSRYRTMAVLCNLSCPFSIAPLIRLRHKAGGSNGDRDVKSRCNVEHSSSG